MYSIQSYKLSKQNLHYGYELLTNMIWYVFYTYYIHSRAYVLYSYGSCVAISYLRFVASFFFTVCYVIFLFWIC